MKIRSRTWRIRLLTALLAGALFVCHMARAEELQGEENPPQEYASAASSDEPDRPGASSVPYGYRPEPSSRAEIAAEELTLMVYIIGSNLESGSGSASKDLAEMAGAGLDTSRTNLLVYTGGSSRWHTDIPSDRNVTMLLKGDTFERIAETEEIRDMADPDTLADFVNDSVAAYPAAHYGLIFWDHGGGPLLGFGVDELFQKSRMSLPMLKEAMDQTPFAGERNLDFVGFDACLMASMEHAVLWSQYANLLIASEELEPGDGWDYQFLNTLNESWSAKKLGKRVVSTFSAFYRKRISSVFAPDTTLAAIDLTRTAQVLEALDDLFVKLSKDLTADTYPAFYKQRKTMVEIAQGADPSGLDLVDIMSFAKRMKARYPAESDALIQSLNRFILISEDNMGTVCGVSLYFPADNRMRFELYVPQLTEAVSLGSGYERFLEKYSSFWLSSESTPAVKETLRLRNGGDVFYAVLSDELTETAAKAYYHILIRNQKDDGTTYYFPAMLYQPVTVTWTGIIEIPKEQKVFCVTTDTSSEPLLFPVRGSEGGFQTPLSAWLSAGIDFGSADLEYDQNITATFYADPDTDEVTIQSISAVEEEDEEFTGKSTLDLSHYKGISFYTQEVQPVYKENGQIEPWANWDFTSTIWGFMQSFDNNIYVEKRSMTEFDERFSIQLVVEDVYGNQVASRPVAFPVRKTVSTFLEQTEYGNLTCLIYADHAVITGYEGEDTELEIPDTIEGVPVTTIGEYAFRGCTVESITLPSSLQEIASGAFSWCRNLTSLEVPEGTERISTGAFSYSALEEISLPSTLTYLESGALLKCSSLTTIRSSSPEYPVKDGVLFSDYGKTLHTCPRGLAHEIYVVPEGTEEIAYAAFAYDDSLTRLILPESVTVIGNYSFYCCTSLKSVILPQSLTEIGVMAFGNFFSTDIGDTPMPIRIGPNVSYIGGGAFKCLNVREYVVDPENPYFSTVDGNLTDKSGETVLFEALGQGGGTSADGTSGETSP